jgi:hypothetical protein
MFDAITIPAMEFAMRTTLTIDDDVLEAAREMASRQRRSIGEVVSELVRVGLRPTSPSPSTAGVPHLPLRADARPVTLKMVNRLRDDLAE